MSMLLIWTLLFINLQKKHSRNKLDSAYFTIILGQICQLRCIPNQILMHGSNILFNNLFSLIFVFFLTPIPFNNGNINF